MTRRADIVGCSGDGLVVAADSIRSSARGRRALAAAQAAVLTGAFSAARLLATAEAGPLDELQRAQIDLLRAQLAFISSRGTDAIPLLLAAARRLERLDIAVAARDGEHGTGRRDRSRASR